MRQVPVRPSPTLPGAGNGPIIPPATGHDGQNFTHTGSWERHMIPHENEIFPVSPEIARAAHCDDAAYREMYARSIDDPEGFWAEQAESLDWIQRWTKTGGAYV